MKRVLQKTISAMLAIMIIISNICFVEVSAAEIPTDYLSASAVMKNGNYLIDGGSVYLFAEYEVGTGQSWSYIRRTSAEVNYVSHTVFTESGNNYVGDKAIIMFRFDAASNGIFRVALYMTQANVVSVNPSCFNFVVTGDEAQGYQFETNFALSDKIPMDYNEAQNMGDLVIDGDLAVFCAEVTDDKWSASVTSTFTCEALLSISIPKQSVSEYALDTDTAGYSVIVIKVTSAGSGTFTLTNSVTGEKRQFPLVATADESGNITIADDRIVYGDVNNDSKVNAMDATLVARYAVGTYTLNEDAIKRADVNGDGKANAMDATLIARYSVKSIDKFPVEEYM